MLQHIVGMTKPNPEQFDLPPVWKESPSPLRDSSAYMHKQKRLFVIASIDQLDTGEYWLHLSVSKPAAQPKFMDLQMVKNHFMGKEATAIQFFPKESQLVDMTDAYHLWGKLKADGQ